MGTQLVSSLRQAGSGIHYLTTRKEKISQEEDYRGFFWNPSLNEIDPACFEGVTAIVNLAGCSIAKKWTPAYKKKIQDSRTDSLRTLKTCLSNLESHSVQYLLSASATGIYPDSYTEYYTETCAEAAEEFLGKTVIKWEKAAREFGELGIPHGILRIGLVLAGHDGALPEMVRPVKWGVGAPVGTGEQWQSWIHLKDLVRILRFLLEERLTGVYNAVAPNPVTNKKLTREIASVLGKPLWMPNLPAFGLKLLLGEMAQLPLASQRVSSEKIESEGFNFHFTNIRHALEDLLS